MKIFDLKNNLLVIKWVEQQPAWGMTKEFVKTLAGRSFDPVTKEWKALATDENIQALIKNGFQPTVNVKTAKMEKPVPILEIPRKEVDRGKLPKDIFPYQVEAVEFLEGRNGSGLLALDMGLGKSMCSIAYTQLHKEERPILVVCPACIKINWTREVGKWGNEDFILLSGTTPHKIPKKYPWVIINYDILANWVDVLKDHGFKMIISDESQAIKNRKAKRTKAFLELCKVIPKHIFLSGTPIKNAPGEFFNILNTLDPKTFPNEWKYLFRYCNPVNTGFGWIFKGLTNGDELFALTRPLMIRMKKEDVLKDLPPKRKIVVPLPTDTSAMNQYKKANQEFVKWAKATKEKKMTEGEKHIELLRQYAYLAKRNAAIDWIENFLESGEKLIVFTCHHNVIDDIFNAFKDIAVVVDGRTGTKEKQDAIDKFQSSPSVKLFIGNIISAGAGITLTAASNMAFVELGYTPGEQEQAESRHHRIGQKADSVFVYYLLADGTIDMDMALMLDDKQKILETVLDGEVKSDIFGMDIAELLVMKAKGDWNGE